MRSWLCVLLVLSQPCLDVAVAFQLGEMAQRAVASDVNSTAVNQAQAQVLPQVKSQLQQTLSPQLPQASMQSAPILSQPTLAQQPPQVASSAIYTQVGAPVAGISQSPVVAPSNMHQAMANSNSFSSLPADCQQLFSDPHFQHRLSHLSFLQQLPGASMVQKALGMDRDHFAVAKMFSPSVTSFACKFANSLPVLHKDPSSTNSFVNVLEQQVFGKPSLTTSTGSMDQRLGTTNLLQAAAQDDKVVQAETDVFVAVLYCIFMLYMFRGMYAKMWCDNFFASEREAWHESEAEDKNSVDANYATAEFEAQILEKFADDSVVVKRGDDDEDGDSSHEGETKPSEGGGLKNMKDLIKWHHEGEWPVGDGGDWVAPLDPFDTIRKHHEPAAHYVRMYCQEAHYWWGYKLMALIHAMFKSSIDKMKKMKPGKGEGEGEAHVDP